MKLILVEKLMLYCFDSFENDFYFNMNEFFW